MGARGRAALKAAARRPLVYTAQDVARFCEVDLKTIHHWCDAGKIPHRRTEGRHLRFRRNHVLAFLRAHGYPLPAQLTQAKPTVFLATTDASTDETARKLAQRCFVVRFENALAAVARLLSEEPDAIVVLDGDATWTPAAAEALARDPETSWVRVVVTSDLSRLHLELPRSLDVE
ncbi:MAG: helix-turn-helix domain-containing protein [Labilithrix sp.]|nr:helix-turn-helix domain-containing protein [Labilithrix sp.]MCW5813022.1 helix-turn-helix domain-containing protein [Labilithrix sp.]